MLLFFKRTHDDMIVIPTEKERGKPSTATQNKVEDSAILSFKSKSLVYNRGDSYTVLKNFILKVDVYRQG